MIRSITCLVCLVVLIHSVFAQVNETEPNDAPDNVGVLTISANDTYTGAITGSGGGSPDDDYWKLAPGSSAIDLNFPDTAPDVTFDLRTYTDSDYQSYIGLTDQASGGDNPNLVALNPAFYYAIHVYSSSSGLFDYTITVEGESALPVELASFTAKTDGNSIMLAWTTESETDNLGFIIDRSDDGTTWQTIASFRDHNELASQCNCASRKEYSYTDNTASPGQSYTYRLSDVSIQGEINSYAPISANTDALPTRTKMDNAYPNPFNPNTKIAYYLAHDSNISITVYDMQGRIVTTLLDGYQAAGNYHINWNGYNDNGAKMPSGRYLVSLQAGVRRQVQKIMLVK